MNSYLYGLTPAYASVVALRNAAYNTGLFKAHKLPVPVISIGNITAGGSGKTPVVEYTASMLIRESYNTAIVSRGYRRSTKGTVVVSEGEGSLVDADRGGDEPVMLALHTPGATIIADENRVRGCLLAAGLYNAGVIVLDDGFQHRRCGRDLDVVVYDATALPSSHTLLPTGRLREPFRNIRRADFILLSRCASLEQANGVMQQIRNYTDAPWAAMRFVPSAIRPQGAEHTQPVHALHGMTAFAFCGIGSPESFAHTLDEAGIASNGMRAFPDHFRYGQTDLDGLQAEAARSGSDCLVTTEKDAVRLAHLRQGSLPVFSIVMGIDFLRGETGYKDAALSAAASHKKL